MQSYSKRKRQWVTGKKATSTAKGIVSLTVRAPKPLKLRWVVEASTVHRGVVSRAVRK